MVLRCYSRRDYVPVWRSFRRPALPQTPASSASRKASIAAFSAQRSSSTTNQETTTFKPRRILDSSSWRAASTSTAGRQESLDFFFPQHLEWINKEPPPSRGKHPLIKKFINEIYSTDRDPDANRAWKAYLSLKECHETEQSSNGEKGTVSLLTQLEPAHHQQLLRAIDPSVAKTRRIMRASRKRQAALDEMLAASGSQSPSSSSSSSLSTSAAAANKILFLQRPNGSRSANVFSSSRPVREYMRRVNIIFADMRMHSVGVTSSSISPHSKLAEPLPTLHDYNHVLTKLATGGHIGPMSSIWNQMNGISVQGEAIEMRPDKQTYRELMVGLSRHALQQIERVQKSEAAKSIHFTGKRKEAEKQKSARAAASGLARFGQVLAPSARSAAILAALRTMALLKDMKDHDVTPGQFTLDFAARTLRLAGHIDGLRLLMDQAYGIDLSSPDSISSRQQQVATGLRPNTHTLNTILMALGEQATVPEMISAYETIAKPLPVTSGESSESPAGGLFSTQWGDIIRSLRQSSDHIADQDQGDGGNQIPSVFNYSHPNQIHPNTKTFEVMMRHCCTEVDPLRSPVALKVVDSAKSIPSLAKESTEMAVAELKGGGRRAAEMEKRSKGGYTLFAKSLLSEAADRAQKALAQKAQGLGIDVVPILPEAKQAFVEALAGSRDNLSEQEEASHEPRPEYLVLDAVPVRALEPDFLPMLEPGSFSITAAMVEPLFSLASQRKAFADLRWTRNFLAQALQNKITEARVIDTAWNVYRARLEKTKAATSAAQDKIELDAIDAATATDAAIKTAASSGEAAQTSQQVEEMTEEDAAQLPPLTLKSQKPADVYAFLNQLKAQYRLVIRQALALEQLLYDRLDERVAHLQARRLARKKNKILGYKEARLQAEKEKLEKEEQDALRKKQAAEMKRIRAFQEQQQRESGELTQGDSRLDSATAATT